MTAPARFSELSLIDRRGLPVRPEDAVPCMARIALGTFSYGLQAVAVLLFVAVVAVDRPGTSGCFVRFIHDTGVTLRTGRLSPMSRGSKLLDRDM